MTDVRSAGASKNLGYDAVVDTSGYHRARTQGRVWLLGATVQTTPALDCADKWAYFTAASGERWHVSDVTFGPSLAGWDYL
jgi:hypothetical protein